MTQTMIQIKEPKAPATDAQIKYLIILIAERECPTVAERFAFAQGFLTKGAASTLIGEAKAAPKKALTSDTLNKIVVDSLSQVQAGVQAEIAAKELANALTEAPAFGYYEIDGAVYYWDVTGKDIAPQLRRLVKITQYGGAVKGSWKKIYAGYTSSKATATYTPYNGKGWSKTEQTKTILVPKVLAEAVLAGVTPLSMEQAAQQGKMMGFCIRCGATLTDPESVAAGIGPVCKTYWS